MLKWAIATIVVAGTSAVAVASVPPQPTAAAKGRAPSTVTKTAATPKAGATLELADGSATVKIPAGAVQKKRTFTATAVLPNGKVAFGSHGVSVVPSGTFKKAVEVCLRVDEGIEDLTGACLGFFDEKHGEWRCEDESLEEKKGLLCGETDHFTTFAILLPGGPGTVVEDDIDLGVEF
ncbi:MAG: hypothetical protein AAGA54_18665 [Myxococcota bacterium]